jgi:LAO/AO transport system kinase
VILVPESGDSVQAMKAGLMEIADIFVLNKADRDGAQRAVRELEAILHLRPATPWNPPVSATVASHGKGIEEVWKRIQEHRDFLLQDERLVAKRKQRLEKKIRELVSRRLKQEFWDEEARRLLSQSLDNFQNQKLSPYRIVDELMEKFKTSLQRKMER